MGTPALQQEIGALEEPMGGSPPGPPMGPQGPAPMGPPEPEVTTFQIGDSVDLTDEEKTALRNLRDTITEPDNEIREKMTPIWQMYENYWRGIQDVIYDVDSQSFLSAAGVLKSAGGLPYPTGAPIFAGAVNVSNSVVGVGDSVGVGVVEGVTVSVGVNVGVSVGV